MTNLSNLGFVINNSLLFNSLIIIALFLLFIIILKYLNIFKLRYFPIIQKVLASFLILVLCLSSLILTDFLIKPIKASAASTPLSTITGLESNILVGENVTFNVNFDNTGSSAGFAPFIDLVFPNTGIDGDDGISFNSATYLGSSVLTSVQVFPAISVVTPNPCSVGLVALLHPVAVDSNNLPLVICGKTGDSFVTLQLPFGSFVPDQPIAQIEILASLSNLADVDAPLNINHRAGFIYGNDSLNNPASDPSIVSNFNFSQTIPKLFTITKTYIGPENETATGPNFRRRYQITADVATGQTVTNLTLTDKLPNTEVYSSFIGAIPNNGSIILTPTSTPANNPNNQLSYRFGSITGATSSNDAQIEFEFYVNDINANLTAVIPPSTGSTTTSVNDALGSLNWTPIDTRDSAQTFTSDSTLNDHTLANKSLAIQKSVTNVSGGQLKPSSVLEYNLNFQVSDYFAFSSIVLNDTLGDGQILDNSFNPTFTVSERGVNTSGNFATQNWSATKDTGYSGASGNTNIIFNLSNQLITSGANGLLQGGCVPGTILPNCTTSNAGGTTGNIRFRVIVDEFYTDVPSNKPIVMGDDLVNQVQIQGVLNNTQTLTPTANTVSDNSSTRVEIAVGAVSKSVYAINGQTNFPVGTRVGPNDTVTYRIRYNTDLTDLENLVLSDYLPLPSFRSNTVNTTFINTVDGTIPPAGRAKFGPNDTFFAQSGITPTITLDNAENKVAFNYGSYNSNLNNSALIEIYLTVQASPDPFADGLLLMNQVSARTNNSNNIVSVANAIAPITLALPNLNISKGIVTTNNPNAVFTPNTVAPVAFNTPSSPTCTLANHRFTGSINMGNLATTPIDSNVTNLDANDLVTYALTIQNTGQSTRGGFDLRIKDTPSTSLITPTTGANICVTDGNGNPISWQAINPADSNPIIGDGIELIDPNVNEGSIGNFNPIDPNNGENIVIITYDLITTPDILPNTTHENNAVITNFSSIDGGVNFATNPNPDESSTLNTGNISASKSIVSTNQTDSLNSDVFIGERVTYEARISIPEGMTNSFQLTDTLDSGLGLVQINSITASSGLSTNIAGGFSSVQSNVNVTNSGQNFTLNFGNITNTNSSNNTLEEIVINYDVIVLNTTSSNQNELKNNSINVSYNNGSVQTLVASSNNVTVKEASLSIVKNAVQTSADAGDTINYTLNISHNPTSGAKAFNLMMSDILPVNTTYVNSSLSTTGTTPTTLNFNSGEITATWDEFALGSTTTISFQATVNNSVLPNTVVNNSANLRWTSLPSSILTPISTYNANSVERTGDSSQGVFNDYSTTSSDSFTIANLAVSKSITTTSESFTTGTNLAIGEIVRYRLVTTVPESTINGFEIQDNLPVGLQFLNDNTSKLALVSNGGLTSSITGVNTCQVSGSSSSITPTCDADVFLTSNTFSSGTDPVFNLGNIQNTDSDGNNEFIILELNAIVLNINTNQAFNNTALNLTPSATNRQNNYSIFSNSGTRTNLITSSSVSGNIAEPHVKTTKNMIITPQNGLDAGRYQITVQNIATGSTATTAFDGNILDNIPSFVTTTGITIVTNPAYNTLTNNSNISTNLLNINYSELRAGDSIVIHIDFTVNSNINAGQTFTNIATTTYTSLPASGTTGNPTGSNSTIERNGTGGVNDFTSSGPAAINIAEGTIDKRLNGSITNYTIGEEVVYDIVVTPIEGISSNTIVRDTLPTGLIYQSHEIITLASNSGGVLTNNFNGAIPSNSVNQVGNIINFSLGNVVNNPNNINSDDSFIIKLRVKVDNNNANQAGTNLTNTVSLITTDPTNSASQTVNDPTPVVISLIAPNLQLTKAFIPSSASPNDLVTIRITARNTGTSPAYDYIISDIFNKSQFNSFNPQPATGYTINQIDNTNTYEITYSGNVLNVGETHTFDIIAKLDSNLINNTIINNEATLKNASTMAGTQTGERVYPDISAQANLNVYTPNLRITKTSDKSVINAGQTMIYNLTVTNLGQGIAENVVVNETLPNLTSFNVANSSVGWVNTSGNNYQFSLGTLNPNQSQTIYFAIDLASTLPENINQLNNTATVNDDGENGQDSDLTNNTATDTDPVSAEPELEITINDNINTTQESNTHSYIVTIRNNGTQTATGVVTNFIIPNNTNFVSATGSFVQNLNNVTWNITKLDPSETLTFTVVVQTFDNFASGVENIIANGTITDDGTNGADPIPANNSDQDIDTLNVAPDLTISKTNNLTTLSPTDETNYQITVTNNGRQEATGVIITDAIPLNTIFVSASDLGVVNGSNIQWPAINIPAGSSVTRTVVFRVNNTVTNGVDNISNTATVNDDGANGADLTPENNTTTDIDVLNAIPELAITKTNNQTIVSAGEELTYVITVENTGNQEAVNITVTETLPQYTTFVGDTNIWSCGANCQTTIPSLLAGESTDIEITIRVADSIPSQVTEIKNTINVEDDGSNGLELNSANNTFEEQDTLEATPDIAVTKTDNETEVVPDQNLTYILTVTNIGTQTAEEVNVIDIIPNELEYISNNCLAQFDSNINNVEWNIPTLNPNEELNCSILTKVKSNFDSNISEIINSVAGYDNGENGDDANLNNNTFNDTNILNANPDLFITTTDNNLSTTPNSQIVYNLNFGNIGNQNSTGAYLTFIVPEYTSLDLSLDENEGWACTPNSQPALANSTCTYQINNLATNEERSLTLILSTDLSLPAGIEDITKLISISDDGANGADPDLSNNTDSEVTPILATPELEIVIDDNKTEVRTGETSIYTVTVKNNGNQTSTNLVITIDLPNNTDYSSLNTIGTVVGNQLIINLSSLDAFDQYTFNFEVNIDTLIPAGVDEIQTIASVVDDGENGVDPILENNSSTDTDILNAVPDLIITKIDEANEMVAGGDISYTLNYSNQGTQEATGVVITEIVPQNTQFNQTLSDNRWVCNDDGNTGSTCTLELNNLTQGESGSIIFVVTIENPLSSGVSIITNNVEINDDRANGEEINQENNEATELTTAEAIVDLYISKTPQKTSISTDEVLIYTINYGNSGNQNATGVILTETIPEGSTFDSINSSPNWICATINSPSTCTYSVGNLNSNASGTVYFAIKSLVSAPAFQDEIYNIITITDDNLNGEELEREDNIAETNTPLIANPNLSIEKKAIENIFNSGQTINYEIIIKNNGNEDASNVIVSELIPQYLTFNSASLTPTNQAGNVINWNLGKMTGGAEIVINLSFVVELPTPIPAEVEQITNTVEVIADNNLRETDSETTPVNSNVDLVVEKTDDEEFITVGESQIYKITVNNLGDQVAGGVVITENIPEGTSFDPINSSDQWICLETTCTITLFELNPNNEQVFDFALILNEDTNLTEITNIVEIGYNNLSGEDINHENNSSSDTNITKGEVDLLIFKENGVNFISADQELTYNLQIQNNGNVVVTGITVEDQINELFEIISVSDDASVVNKNVTWSNLTLNPNEIRTLTVTVKLADRIPADIEEITNTATITSDGVHGEEINNSNNESQDTDLIDANPELTIEEDILSDNIYPNEEVKIKFNYSNTGKQDATGVELTFIIPQNTTFNDPNWICDKNTVGGICKYNVGNLDSMETGEIEITLLAVSNEEFIFSEDTVNFISIVRINDDGNNGEEEILENNVSEESLEPSRVDLVIEKSVNKNEALIQEIVTYKFIFRNLGPDTATEVEFEDILPTDLQFIVARRNNQVIETDTTILPDGRTRLIFKVGSVFVGPDDFVEVDTRIIAGRPTSIENSVFIRSREADPEISNNRSMVNLTVKLPPVSQKDKLANLIRSGAQERLLSILIFAVGLVLVIGYRGIKKLKR
jgi:large repetitive protein